MFCWRSGNWRRRKTWNLVPGALMWVFWKRNMRAFEGVELSFSQFSSSLRSWSLIFFPCTHSVPNCIEDCVEFVENQSSFAVFSLPLGVPLVHIRVFDYVYEWMYVYLIKKREKISVFNFCGNPSIYQNRWIESKNSKKKKRFESPIHTSQRPREQKVREVGETELSIVFVKGQKCPSHLGIDSMLLGAFKEIKKWVKR